jgi:hypothetical protein
VIEGTEPGKYLFKLLDSQSDRHAQRAPNRFIVKARQVLQPNQGARDPVVFYGREDGRRRELAITSVSSKGARGYLVVYPG